VVFDSDLNQHKRMPCSVPLKGNGSGVPASMVRQYRVEARNSDGTWTTVFRDEQNYQRLVRVPLNVRTSAIRLVPEQTWGASEARIFSVDLLEQVPTPVSHVAEGKPWLERVAQIPPKDLAEPQSGLEATEGRKSVGA
jgi:hypothetical protein